MRVRPEQVSLWHLEEQDLELVLAWRNDPEVMKWLPSAQRPLLWQDHLDWFRRYHSGLVWQYDWTIQLETGSLVRRRRRVGTVHYVNHTSEIGLLVGEKTLWGQGIGRIALEKALHEVTGPHWELLRQAVGPVWAVVHPENTPSRKLFE